ncbi:MAG: hypothetical protein AAGC71_14485 [Pseudomonadota bacterium]
MAVVIVLSAVMLMLDPEQWPKWLAALAFILFAYAAASYTVSRPGRAKSRKYCGSLRAALVGAGVLLATALGFSLTDAIGWTGENGVLEDRGFLVFLPALAAVVIELVGMALEKHAENDPDS